MNNGNKNIETVPVQNAVGKVLLHDITRIIPDVCKGPCFKKGHIITDEDISVLLDVGKRHVYVANLDKGDLHENEAAGRIARASLGHGLKISGPREGKIGFRAKAQGLLKINVEGLYELNSVPEIVFSTIHTGQYVKKEQELAGTRVIPLYINEKQVIEAEKVCHRYHPIIEIRPFKKLDVGLVVTGSEVYRSRIKDGFGPVVQKKIEAFGSRILRKEIVSDDIAMIVDSIKDLIEDGAGMIAITGGMSVDPDDRTPTAIKLAGGHEISYGVPVLPGAMFMLAYINEVPVIGLPGCVMYHKTTIFDLVVPRILAGETVTKSDMIKMGHGGFCSNCDTCRFPLCSFGK